jgi:prepilin-type processing-associated H-X9-DG protein
MNSKTLSIITATTIFAATSLLIFAYINKIKSNYRKSCFMNQKKIATSLLSYISDYDDNWPSAQVFTTGAFSSENLQGCPQASIQPAYEELKKFAKIQKLTGYAYNINLELIITRNNSTISFPQTTIAVFESPAGIISGGNPYPGRKHKKNEKSWERHNSGSHYLFCDGHVSWLKAKTIAINNDPEHNFNNGITPNFIVRGSPPKKHNH